MDRVLVALVVSSLMTELPAPQPEQPRRGREKAAAEEDVRAKEDVVVAVEAVIGVDRHLPVTTIREKDLVMSSHARANAVVRTANTIT